MAAPELFTGRLILRSFRETDIEAVFRIFSDETVNRFLPWFPLKTMAEAKTFYAENYARSARYRYAICLREDSVPIGYVNISDAEPYDLGYGLITEHWNRGIVTEACAALLKAAGEDGLPYVTATHDRDNPASGRVMEKLGMRYLYSYEEQWQPKNLRVTFRLYQLNLDGSRDRMCRKYWDESDIHCIEEGLGD